MSMTSISAQTAQEQATQALAAIKQADAEHYAARRAAELRCDAMQREPLRQLEHLKEKFQETAHDLAIAAGECPYTHRGSHMDIDEVSVTESGLVLTWDINGGYAPSYFVATWEALAAAYREEEVAA